MKKNEYAEVKFISADGFLIDVCGNTYFAAFKDFPYKADIDLNVEILKNPAHYSKIMHAISLQAATLFGQRGGLSRSPRKSAASRLNGSKGGRPRKKKDSALA